MEAMAIGIMESVDDDHMHARVGQVIYLGEKMIDYGVPIVTAHRRARHICRREEIRRIFRSTNFRHRH